MVQNYYEGFELVNPFGQDPSGVQVDPSGIPIIPPIDPSGISVDPSGNKPKGDKSVGKFIIGSITSILGLIIGLAMAAILIYWAQTPEIYGTHPAPNPEWEYSVYNVFMRIWEQIKYYTVGSLNEWTAKYKERVIREDQLITDSKYAWIGSLLMVMYPLVIGLVYGITPFIIAILIALGVILAYVMNTAHHIDTSNILRFLSITNMIRIFILFVGIFILFMFFLPIMGVSYITTIVLLLYITITSLFNTEFKDLLREVFNNSKKIMLLLALGWIAYSAKYLNGYELPAGIVNLSVGRYIQGVLGSLIVILMLMFIKANFSNPYSAEAGGKSYTYAFIASIIMGTLYSVGTQHGK
jgi:hypothetical protein